MLLNPSQGFSAIPGNTNGPVAAGRFIGCLIVVMLIAGQFAAVDVVVANSPPGGTLTLQVDTISPDVAMIAIEVEGVGKDESPTILEFDVANASDVLHDLPGMTGGIWNITAIAADDVGETLYESRHRAVMRGSRDVLVRIDGWIARHDSEHGIFLGYDLDRTILINYATTFETRTVPEVAGSTGLKPDATRAAFGIYGSKEAWAVTACAARYGVDVAGCYVPDLGRALLAHWPTPEVMNDGLLAHEYVHLLAVQIGGITLPFWFDESLASAESWRIALRADSWDNAKTDEWWERASASTRPIPNVPLISHEDRDDAAFLLTAVPFLLENYGGRDALRTFFASTRGGKRFNDAFQTAFGLTVAEFQSAYERHVIGLRTESGTLHNRPQQRSNTMRGSHP